MGRADNRKSMKMRRKKAQRKLKARIKKRIVAGKAKPAAAKRAAEPTAPIRRTAE
jgi:hypothetical protein